MCWPTCLWHDYFCLIFYHFCMNAWVLCVGQEVRTREAEGAISCRHDNLGMGIWPSLGRFTSDEEKGMSLLFGSEPFCITERIFEIWLLFGHTEFPVVWQATMAALGLVQHVCHANYSLGFPLFIARQGSSHQHKGTACNLQSFICLFELIKKFTAFFCLLLRIHARIASFLGLIDTTTMIQRSNSYA